MKCIYYLFIVFLVSACSQLPEEVSPGRGAEKEVGPMVNVYPSGEEARVDRHGLWRGMKGDTVIWEVRYTRGNPTGPYREWNTDGELIATWPYNWDGEVEGWARWFESGEPGFKKEVSADDNPEFDVIGHQSDFKQWLKEQ